MNIALPEKDSDKILKISYWKRIFLFLSGTNIKCISLCSDVAITNYSILGSLVCVPAILSLCSSYYAFSLVFPSGPYVLLSFLWMLLIVTFDRAIVAANPLIYEDGDEELYQMEKNKYISKLRRKNFWVGLFRIIISVALGFVITEPLCTGIFEKEVNEQLSIEFRQKKQDAEMPFNQQQEKLLSEQRSADSTLYGKLNATTQEIEGNSASQQKGRGDIAIRKEKEEVFFTTERNNKSLKISSQLDSLAKERFALVNNLKKSNSEGLLSRINALHNFAKHEPGILIALWVLRALLLGIELMPLALKGKFKTKTDEYVRICHRNAMRAIEFNNKPENSITMARLRTIIAQENIELEKIVKEKKIKKAVTDFKFLFRMNEDATTYYTKSKKRVDRTLKEDLVRIAMHNMLSKAYEEFLEKIERAYSKKNSSEDGEADI